MPTVYERLGPKITDGPAVSLMARILCSERATELRIDSNAMSLNKVILVAHDCRSTLGFHRSYLVEKVFSNQLTKARAFAVGRRPLG